MSAATSSAASPSSKSKLCENSKYLISLAATRLLALVLQKSLNIAPSSSVAVSMFDVPKGDSPLASPQRSESTTYNSFSTSLLHVGFFHGVTLLEIFQVSHVLPPCRCLKMEGFHCMLCTHLSYR